MKKSIETIWKEGFIEQEALVAPTINDLYNQKSQNIVDKLKRMFDLNLKAIIVAAIAVLSVLTFNGLPFLGLFISAMLMFLVVKGYQQFKQLQKIDNNVNSYQYLKSFNDWMRNVIEEYTTIYRFVYPMLFVACITRFGFSEAGLSIMEGMAKDFPNIPVVVGMPIVIPMAVALIAFLLAYFAGVIYRLDMKSLYGQQFNKLQEIIADMETLKTGQPDS